LTFNGRAKTSNYYKSNKKLVNYIMSLNLIPNKKTCKNQNKEAITIKLKKA